MIENDTWYKCTVCGREGRVGRCCGDETRIPLNKLAMEEFQRMNTRQQKQVEAIKRAKDLQEILFTIIAELRSEVDYFGNSEMAQAFDRVISNFGFDPEDFKNVEL